jgi:hypothetical protein
MQGVAADVQDEIIELQRKYQIRKNYLWIVILTLGAIILLLTFRLLTNDGRLFSHS